VAKGDRVYVLKLGPYPVIDAKRRPAEGGMADADAAVADNDDLQRRKITLVSGESMFPCTPLKFLSRRSSSRSFVPV
jgi:hypothetical protein